MKSAALSTGMSVSIPKTGRESVVFIGFPHNLTGQFRCQFAERHARCLNLFQAAMYIAVHGSLDVRMSRDHLQGINAKIKVSQQRGKRS